MQFRYQKPFIRLKKTIAAFLASMMFAMPVCADIVGVPGNAGNITNNGNVTDINGGFIHGNNTINHFDEFGVGSGQTVNQHFNTNNAVNMVNNRVTIDGIYNAYKSGSIGGNVMFISPLGMAIGANGVMNVGSMQAVIPTVAAYNAMTSAFNAMTAIAANQGRTPNANYETNLGHLDGFADIDSTALDSAFVNVQDRANISTTADVAIDGRISASGLVKISANQIVFGALADAAKANITNTLGEVNLIANTGDIVGSNSMNIDANGNIVLESISGNVGSSGNVVGTNASAGSTVKATASNGSVYLASHSKDVTFQDVTAKNDVNLSTKTSGKLTTTGTTSGNNVTLVSAKDIETGTINATNGAVSITSETGMSQTAGTSITSNNGTTTIKNNTSGDINLSKVTSKGLTVNNLAGKVIVATGSTPALTSTAGTTINAKSDISQTGTGVAIDSTGRLSLVSTEGSIGSSGSSLNLQSADSITATANGTAPTAGNIYLTSAANATYDNVQGSNAIDLRTTGSSSLKTTGLTKGKSVTVNSGSTASVEDIEATNGNVDITSAGNFTQAGGKTITSKGDTIIKSTGGSVDFGAITSKGGVSITGNNNVTQAASTLVTSAGNLSLTSNNGTVNFGNVKTTAGDLTVNAKTGITQTTGTTADIKGDVFLTNIAGGSGNISTATINAKNATITNNTGNVIFNGLLTATGGTVKATGSGISSTTAKAIDAGTIILTASTGSIGSNGSALNISATNNAQASAVTGDVYLTSDKSITYNNIIAGNIADLRTTGAGSVLTTIGNTSAGVLNLNSSANIIAGNLTSTTGSLTLDAVSGITQSDNTSIEAKTNLAVQNSTSGDITLKKVKGSTVGITNNAVGGNVILVTNASNPTVTSTSTGSGVGTNISAKGSILQNGTGRAINSQSKTQLSAQTGSIKNSSGSDKNSTLQIISTGDVTASAAQDAFISAALSGGVYGNDLTFANVTGNNVYLGAKTLTINGISGSSMNLNADNVLNINTNLATTNGLTLDANTLVLGNYTIANTGSGDINIYTDTATTLNAVTNTAGNINIGKADSKTGNLTLNGIINGANVNMYSNGSILSALDNAINASGNILLSAGSIGSASNALNVTANSVSADAQTGINLGSKNADLNVSKAHSATGDVKLSTLNGHSINLATNSTAPVVKATAGNVIINSSKNISQTGANNAITSSGDITLTSAGSIGSGSKLVLASGGKVNATTSAEGDVNLGATTGTINLGTITLNNGIFSFSGDTGKNVTLNVTENISSNGVSLSDLKLLNQTSGKTITASNGNVSLDRITTANLYDVTATNGNLLFDSITSLTSNGTIKGQNVTLSNLGSAILNTVTATNGAVTVSSTGDVTLNKTVSGDSVTFNTGNIIAGTANALINSAAIDLNSTGSIGSDSAYINVLSNNAIKAKSTGTNGNIYMASTASAIFDGISAGNIIDLKTTGASSNLTTLGTINAKSIKLNSGGATTVGNLNASGSTVDITSAGNFTQTSGTTIASKTDTSINSTNGNVEYGTINSDGKIDITAKNNVVQTASTTATSKGATTITATNGTAQIGNITSGGALSVTASGNITQDGSTLLSSKGNTTLDSKNGKVSFGNIKTTTGNLTINSKTGMIQSTGSTVNVDGDAFLTNIAGGSGNIETNTFNAKNATITNNTGNVIFNGLLTATGGTVNVTGLGISSTTAKAIDAVTIVLSATTGSIGSNGTALNISSTNNTTANALNGDVYLSSDKNIVFNDVKAKNVVDLKTTNNATLKTTGETKGGSVKIDSASTTSVEDVTADNGAVTIISNGDFTQVANKTIKSSTNNDVTITSTNGSSQIGTINSGRDVNVTAKTNITQSSGSVINSIRNILLSATTGTAKIGNISSGASLGVSATGDITQTAGTTISSASNSDITLSSTAGSVALSNVNSAKDINVNANKNITQSAGSTLTSIGATSLTATTGTAQVGNITSGGTLNITAKTGVTQSDSTLISSTGKTTINNTSNSINLNNVKANGIEITNTTGDINLKATNASDTALTSTGTTTLKGNNIIQTGSGRAINSTGKITMTAAADIKNAATNSQFRVNSPEKMDITAGGNLVLGSIAGDGVKLGDIDINNKFTYVGGDLVIDGDISAESVDFSGLSSYTQNSGTTVEAKTGDVNIASTGNAVLDGLLKATNGTVTVDSGAAITSNSGVGIEAKNVVLVAGTTIGSDSKMLNIKASESLKAHSGSDMFINSVDTDMVVNQALSDNGSVKLTASGTKSNITINSISAANGNIAVINNAQGMININTDLTINNTGEITANGTDATSGIKFASGKTTTNNGTLNVNNKGAKGVELSGTLTNNGTAVFANSASTTLNGIITNNSGKSLEFKGLGGTKGDFTFANGSTLNNNGTLNIDAMKVSLAGNAKLNNTSSATINSANGFTTDAGTKITNSGSAFIVNNSGGAVTLNGEILNNSGKITLSNNADSLTSISSKITNASGATIEFNQGAGANSGLKFLDSSNFTNNGIFNLNNNGSLGTDFSGILVNATTGTIDVNNNAGLLKLAKTFTNGGTADFTSAAGISILGTVNNNAGTLAFNTTAGDITLGTNSVVINKSNLNITSAGTVNLTDNAKLTNTSGITDIKSNGFNSGTNTIITNTAGETKITNASNAITLGGQLKNDGGKTTVTNNADSLLTVSGTITNAEAGTVELTNNSTGANSGILISGADSTVIDNKGLFSINNKGAKGTSLAGKITNSKTFNVNNEKGNIEITKDFTNSKDATFTNTGEDIIINAKVDNSSALVFNNNGTGSILIKELANITNNGTLDFVNAVGAKNIQISDGGQIHNNAGTLNITNNANGKIDINGIITNKGTLNMTSAAGNASGINFGATSNVTNDSIFNIVNNGDLGTNLNGTFLNNETLDVKNSAGALTLAGVFTNTKSTTLTNTSSSNIVLDKTINNNNANSVFTANSKGGILIGSNAVITNANQMTLTNDTAGAVTMANGAQITNNKTLNITNSATGGTNLGGKIINATTGIITVNNSKGDMTIASTADIENSGKINLNNLTGSNDLNILSTAIKNLTKGSELIIVNGEEGVAGSGDLNFDSSSVITNQGTLKLTNHKGKFKMAGKIDMLAGSTNEFTDSTANDFIISSDIVNNGNNVIFNQTGTGSLILDKNTSITNNTVGDQKGVLNLNNSGGGGIELQGDATNKSTIINNSGSTVNITNTSTTGGITINGIITAQDGNQTHNAVNIFNSGTDININANASISNISDLTIRNTKDSTGNLNLIGSLIDNGNVTLQNLNELNTGVNISGNSLTTKGLLTIENHGLQGLTIASDFEVTSNGGIKLINDNKGAKGITIDGILTNTEDISTDTAVKKAHGIVIENNKTNNTVSNEGIKISGTINSNAGANKIINYVKVDGSELNLTSTGSINTNSGILLENYSSTGFKLDGKINNTVNNANTNVKGDIHIIAHNSDLNIDHKTNDSDVYFNNANGGITMEVKGKGNILHTGAADGIGLIATGDIHLNTEQGNVGEYDTVIDTARENGFGGLDDSLSINVKTDGKISTNAKNNGNAVVNVRSQDKNGNMNIGNISSDNIAIIPSINGNINGGTINAKNAYLYSGKAGDGSIKIDNAIISGLLRAEADGNIAINSTNAGQKMDVDFIFSKNGSINLNINGNSNIDSITAPKKITVTANGDVLHFDNLGKFEVDRAKDIYPKELMISNLKNGGLLDIYNAYVRDSVVLRADNIHAQETITNGVSNGHGFHSANTEGKLVTYDIQGVTDRQGPVYAPLVEWGNPNYHPKDTDRTVRDLKLTIGKSVDGLDAPFGADFKTVYANYANINAANVINELGAPVAADLRFDVLAVNAKGRIQNNKYTVDINNIDKNYDYTIDATFYTKITGPFRLYMNEELVVDTTAPIVVYNPHRIFNLPHTENSFQRLTNKSNKIEEDTTLDSFKDTRKNTRTAKNRKDIRWSIASEDHQVIGSSAETGTQIKEILDISKGGMLVATDSGLHKGELLNVNFLYKGIPFDVQGEVVRVDNDHTAGVKFINMDRFTSNVILYMTMMTENL